MNVFAATVEAADGGPPALRIGGQRLSLAPDVVAAHPGIADRAGEEVVVGIRPEAFTDVAVEPGAPADRVIEVTVDLVESLGAELIVHAQVSDPPPVDPDASEARRQVAARRGRGVARLGTRSRPAAGEVLKLAVDTATLHLFDPDTGASLRAAVDA